jgi:hypothetical protein
MVDFAAVIAADPGGFQPFTYGPGILGELRNLGGFDGERVIVDEEKPVAAPGNIAGDGSHRGLTLSCFFQRRAGTFSTETLPSSCSVALTSPTGVSIRCTPA